MRGRLARRRQHAGVDVTTAADGAAYPARPITIAAAAACSLAAILLVGGLSPISGADAAGPRTDSTSGLTMITSPDSWWTMDKHRLLTPFRRSAPRRLRHRRHRHRQVNRQTPISGFDLFRPHSSRNITDSASTSGRRSFRHVDGKGTSGSDVSVFKVVADPRRPDNSDPIVVEAETDLAFGPSVRFRFCDNRLISSAIDPKRCRNSPDSIMSRCLAELAELDDEAEVKFQQFSDVMALFDCGHAYSLASRCAHCKVRTVLWN